MPLRHLERLRDGVPSAAAGERHVRDLTKPRACSYSTSSKSRIHSTLPNSFRKEDSMPVIQLNPKKTALVLIDLQNATVGVNTAPYSVVQVVANSKKLSEAFRTAGAPVIYVNVDFNGFLEPPADQPFNMGDTPIPAVASQM